MATLDDFEALIEWCLRSPEPGVPLPQKHVVMADMAKYDDATQTLEAGWEGQLVYRHGPRGGPLGFKRGGFSGVLVEDFRFRVPPRHFLLVIAPRDDDDEVVVRIEGVSVPPELEGDISLGEDYDPLDQTALYSLPWPSTWLSLYPRLYYGP